MNFINVILIFECFRKKCAIKNIDEWEKQVNLADVYSSVTTQWFHSLVELPVL